MKVLVVHNRYRSTTPSGENVVVDSDIDALSARGVEVVPYIRESDEVEQWSRARTASLGVLPIYAPRAVADIKSLIRTERPDVLHLHNPFPLISPAVVRVAAGAGVPVVQSVHNHRHVCVKGTYYRDDRICRDCLGKTIPWPAVAHGCYQDSRLRSVPMATALVVHRRTWQLVDRYLALTSTMRDHLLSAGIGADRITIRPNTVSDPGAVDMHSGTGVLFAGRLTEEKGVALLAAAWRRQPVGALGGLTIAGQGPLQGLVDALLAEREDVRYIGQLDAAGIAAAIRAAAVVVVPSTCPEAFPRIVVEAFAHGRPVLGTALGGLPGIIAPEVGILVEPDVASMAEGLGAVASLDNGRVRALARQRYDSLYAPDVVYSQLIDVYSEVARDVTGKRLLSTGKGAHDEHCG